MSSTVPPQENAAGKDPGPRDPGLGASASGRQRGRKRSHPSDIIDDGAPPNVKLPTANMQQQKQMLYKKVAEAERNPFFLHPHQVTSLYPFFPFPSPVAGATTPANNSPSSAGTFSPGIYPLVQQSPPNIGLTMLNPGPSVLTPPSSVSTSSTLTTQANSVTAANLVISSGVASSSQQSGVSRGNPLVVTGPGTPPRAPYAAAAQFYAPFMKCPMSPPTPSGIATLSVLSPWNIATMSQMGVAPSPTPVISTHTPRPSSSGIARRGKRTHKLTATTTSTEANSTTHANSTTTTTSAAASITANVTTAPSILPKHVLSPRPGFTSIHSPLGLLHASPLSPMMLIQSPYASSVSSCPSVSSSSGCSSDGGASFTTGLHMKHHYAPSEYHVGPRRPLCEKLTEEDVVSEGANSSGRNTPVDPTEVDEDPDTLMPNNRDSGVFSSTSSSSSSSSSSARPGRNEGLPSFTPFSITSQGPSISQPIRRPGEGITAHGSTGGGSGSHVSAARQGHGCDTGSRDAASVSRQPVSSRVNRVDMTCQPVSYPYSVESGGHAVNPLSVESNSHGYVSSVLQSSSSSGERPSSGVSSMSSSLSSRESTPDPEETEPIPPNSSTTTMMQDSLAPPHHLGNGTVGVARSQDHAPRGSDTFCLVPGRLSLLSSTQKYKVTVDEVRRRLSHPECLNASVLGGILRRAKSKNGGHVLRQRLDSIGLSLPPGRRKATELSLLTSLVEGEASHLSSDFKRICETYFPHTELAQIIARQHMGTPQAQQRVSMVKAAQLVISELQAMLNAVGGPSNIKSNDPNNPYPGLTNFSLLSHGFGNPAISTSLGVVQTYLQELLAFYDGRKPVQPDNRFATFGGDKSHGGGVQFVNGMPHPAYAAQMTVPNLDQQPAHHHHHHTQSIVSMKQEPGSSPSNCTL